MEFTFNPIRPRSLRGQLIGLVAVLAIPLLALQLWWGYREARSAEEAASADALALAEATSLSVDVFLAQAEQILTGTVAQFGVGLLSGPPCGGEMQSIVNVFRFVVDAMTVDADGTVLCATRPVPVGMSATGWSWYPGMMENPQFALGPPVLGQMLGEWILPLVTPIVDDQGRFAGALVGSLRLAEFDRMLRGDRRDGDVLVTIATADRVVLARSWDAARWVGRELPPTNARAVAVGPGRETARGPDFDGVERAWGQVELRNGWVVYVGVPEVAVYGPARAAAALRTGVTLAIVLVAMICGGLSYVRINSALRRLASGVPLIEGGAAVPVPEGTPTEFRAVVRQFNEMLQGQNLAEAAERATRERYQSLFENAVFGLYVSTPAGRFVEVNASLVSMLGYESAPALVEAGLGSLYVSPVLRTELVEEALQSQVVRNAEAEWVRADGVLISVRLNGKIINMTDGEPAFEMIVQDVTDEKFRENELRHTQKMEAIGKLAGGVAHDFNNLLTVIGGNSELIEDRLSADDPLRDDLGQIIAASDRAALLTRQLLAFSRKEPRETRPVDVNDIIADMERMLVRLIGEDVTLEARLGSDLQQVSIDPGELEQIIMNLVLNARDAMPMGGPVVIETQSSLLEAGSGSETARDGVSLLVRDRGIGMDSETRKRIFEPFFTTKPIGDGTGLGLSTVYGIVQRAEGHVEVESALGDGTTIEIWFPTGNGRDDRRERVAESAAATGGHERILVVEDEEMVRVFVSRALEDAGYELLVARDGQDALEICEGLDSPVDLVLTDVVMPRMGGPELAERLAAMWPGTAVLYMGGYMDNKAVEQQSGSLIRKPFKRTGLYEHVRSMLDFGHARDGGDG